MDHDAVGKMLTDVAPLVDAARLTLLDDGGWLMALAEDIQIDIELDSEVGRLVLSCDVCPLPDQAREKALQFLLEYNYVWPLHGGIRTAVDKGRDWVAVLLDIPVSYLTVQRLDNAIANFRAAIESLRRVLELMSAGANTSGEEENLLGTGAMRV